MAVRKPQVRRPGPKPATVCVEHEAVIADLRGRLAALEQELDEVRGGFEVLTRALRRRGCCDGVDAGHGPL